MRKILFRITFVVTAFGSLSACAALENRVVAIETPVEQKKAPEPVKVAQSVIDPDIMYQILVGEIANQRGAEELSLEHYMEAARSSRDLAVVRRATRLAVMAKDNERAEELAGYWIELEPDDPEARLVMASIRVRKGQADQAKAELEELLRLVGDDQKGFGLIIKALGREPDKTALLKAVLLLVESRPNNPDALHAQTVLAMHANDLGLASRTVERLIQLAPDRDEVWVIYARIMLVTDRVKEAVDKIRPVVGEGEHSKLLRITYARLLLNAKLNDEAREQFEKILEIDPANPDVLYSVALLSINARQDEQAWSYLSRLLETSRHESAASYYLGQIEERRKNYTAAVSWYGRVSQGNFAADAGVRIAVLTGKRGDVVKARSQLQKLREVHPDRALPIYVAEGAMLRDLGLFDEAVKLYGVAIENFSDNVDLRYGRSLVAEKLDDLDLAESDLRAILDRDPNNVTALNALGYTLADRTTRYDEALELIKRAFHLNPKDPAIIDSMGWIQYRLGNLQDGLHYLKDAFAKFQDPEIASHLGEVLWTLGDKAEARRIWEQSLKDNPDSPALLQVIKKFIP